MSGTPYTVFGYKGKQVRRRPAATSSVRSSAVLRAPRVAEVYDVGGGRFSNASVIEAIELAQEIVSEGLDWSYRDENRVGDHIWWIGDNSQ